MSGTRSGRAAGDPTGAHRFAVRVYYEDTDAGGIVYHAQYLCFAERARTELLRALGADHQGLAARSGGLFVVRRATVDFRRPARLDDALVVVTAARGVRGARLDLRQEISKDGQVLVVIDIELAFISSDLRPARLPPWLVERFADMDFLPLGDA